MDTEVSTEAKRIMVVALGKLYSSRTQRGGLRLHRSLLLTLVMKSARDMYHAAQEAAETPACERHGSTTEASLELQSPASIGEPRTLPQDEEEEKKEGEEEEVVVVEGVAPSPTEPRPGADNKENVCPAVPAPHSRKRRGKAAAEPDFLPRKKAKLEQAQCPQQLVVGAVLMDFVNCSSELGARPTPIPLHTAIAAC